MRSQDFRTRDRFSQLLRSYDLSSLSRLTVRFTIVHMHFEGKARAYVDWHDKNRGKSLWAQKTPEIQRVVGNSTDSNIHSLEDNVNRSRDSELVLS